MTGQENFIVPSVHSKPDHRTNSSLMTKSTAPVPIAESYLLTSTNINSAASSLKVHRLSEHHPRCYFIVPLWPMTFWILSVNIFRYYLCSIYILFKTGLIFNCYKGICSLYPTRRSVSQSYHQRQLEFHCRLLSSKTCTLFPRFFVVTADYFREKVTYCRHMKMSMDRFQ